MPEKWTEELVQQLRPEVPARYKGTVMPGIIVSWRERVEVIAYFQPDGWRRKSVTWQQLADALNGDAIEMEE